VILRALGLGDLLTAVPALRALARAFPRHRRLLAAPAALGPLVELIGAVDELVHVRELEPLPADCHAADVAVNLHGRGPQSHRLILDTGPRRLVAFRNDALPASRGMPEWRAGEYEVGRWCRLLAQCGIPADQSELHLPRPYEPAAEAVRGATLIHPGAASPARRWPAERFAAIARQEHESGRLVVVTGGAGEQELAAEVARLAGLPDDCSLAGRTDLRLLAGLVAVAGRVVCGDTGIAHLATAFGTPSVVLFGPTPPSEWGPPAGDRSHRVLWAGRRGDPHQAGTDPGLLDLTPADVLAELRRLPV
jgi:ADP-heptose:LPS heptosyltransferase